MNVRRSIYALALCAMVASPYALADRSSATAAIAEATASVRAAERDGADEYAPVDLRAARDNLSAARADAESRRWSDAERMAIRALRDAELADAKARAVRAEQNLAELQSVVDTLRQELDLDGEES